MVSITSKIVTKQGELISNIYNRWCIKNEKLWFFFLCFAKGILVEGKGVEVDWLGHAIETHRQ